MIAGPITQAAPVAFVAPADAELVSLGIRLRFAMSVYLAEEEKADTNPDGEDGTAAAYEVCHAIVQAMEPLPVRSLEGLRAKGLAAHWCGRWTGTSEPDSITESHGDTRDHRLLDQILDALIADEGLAS